MAEYHFRKYFIPDRMMAGIKRYVEEGIEPGHFLQAVICNDLAEAVSRADDENLDNLAAYVVYFYNKVPSNLWGSKEKMDKWLTRCREHRDET